MVALLISVHAIVTLFYGLVVGTIVAVPLAYVLKTSWAKTQARLKQLWTIQYPIYREYWRFKKDDEMARQFNYNFPFFANHPLLRSVSRSLLSPAVSPRQTDMHNRAVCVCRVLFVCCCAHPSDAWIPLQDSRSHHHERELPAARHYAREQGRRRQQGG
jgi:hypothetical protein